MNFDPRPIYPKHPLLKKHIAYYYFLKSSSPNFNTRYFAFPHTHTVLNIHNGAGAEFGHGITTLRGDGHTAPICLVQGIRDFPMLAVLEGILDKVTIIFKPLGINYFLEGSVGEIITSASEIFREWDHQPNYKAFLQGFFNAEQEKREMLLEDFLLSRYREIPELVQMETALSMISNLSQEHSVEEVASALNVTSRTLNRMFNKYVGVSPVGYKKVARFRHSLENNVFADKLKRMTDLAYQSNFYDQAYFNKVYREMTGSNPQQFFRKIEKFADDQLIFLFEKRKIV
jgi:AraC-like DNA-binding protein